MVRKSFCFLKTYVLGNSLPQRITLLHMTMIRLTVHSLMTPLFTCSEALIQYD